MRIRARALRHTAHRALKCLYTYCPRCDSYFCTGSCAQDS